MDFVRMAPGVSATRPTGRGFDTVSAFGSGVNENLFFIDGLDQTDPTNGWSLPFISTDSVQEVEIVANGASAEFGNYQGAVFNVVTRQGGNDWRFDASYYHQSQEWMATGPELDCDCPSGETGFDNLRNQDATAQVGGPLLRDRLWILGNFQYRRAQENWPGSDPDYVYAGQEKRFFEKLSFQASPGLTLRQTYQDGNWRYPDGVDRDFPAEVGVSWRERGPVLGIGSSFVASENTLADVTFTGSFKSYGGDPNNGSLTLPYRYDLATGKASGGAYLFGRSWTDRVSVNAKLTHYAGDFLGVSHEFKFGLQFTHGSDRWIYGYPGGVQYYDYAGEPYIAYIAEPDTAGGVVRRVGLFAEDVVALGDRLTLNFGVRFDRNSSESPDVPAVDLVGEETGETIGGLGPVFTWNVVSPRLGVTLALDRDARTLLRASFGRFYQGAFAGEFERFHPGYSLWTTALYDPATGAYSNVVEVFDFTAGQGFDPGIRPPYTDQLSVGLDREIFTGGSFSASYVRKHGKRFTGWEDIGGVYGTAPATLPDGRTLTVYPLLNSREDRFYLLTNPEDFYLDYQGLILTFQKRWAERWQAMVSYTLSESKGLLSSSFRAPGGIQDSSGGFVLGGRDPNNLINAEGNLTGDRTHMFRVQSSFEVPKIGVLVGASYQHLTGAPWAATSIVRLPQGPTSIFIEPRGSQRLPSQDLLDLRVSKAFTFERGRRIEILLDLLNALNDDASQRVATTNYFSPSFAEGRDFLRPRRAMIGVRASF